MRIAFLASAALGCALAPPANAQTAAPDPLALVDARYDRTAAVARQIWEFAELGYQENRSSALLQAELAKATSLVATGGIDWQKVRRLAETVLDSKSKHLMTASYLSVALLRMEKLAGMAQGVHILLELLENFWIITSCVMTIFRECPANSA